MMKTSILSVLFILCLFSCDNKESICPDDEAFCSIVETGDYDNLQDTINAFMADLTGNSDDQLEQVRAWFDCKSCVEKAKLICNSCLESFPEQSHMEIEFISNGQEDKKNLYILMSTPMVFADFN